MALSALLALPMTSIVATQPNILLLMPDQWRWDWDGVAHADAGRAPPLHLPNIESLREKGTSFPRGAVVPAPVCAPSRSCMASLREYDHAGTATNFANDYQAGKIPTYFSALQNVGYHTMSTGKDDLTKATQLGYKLGKDTRNGSDTYHARELGFSDSIRFSGKDDVVSTYPAPHEPYGYMLNASVVELANGTKIDAYAAHRACLTGKDAALCEASTYPHELYEDDWTAAQAVALLERAPRDSPWFLWVSFPGPHPPFSVTADMAAEVTGRSWPQAVDSDNKTKLCGPSEASGNTDEPSHDRSRCNYAAEMENLDRLFGVVLDAAKARGDSVDTNTVVCFFSDHGEMLNDHDDTDKSKPWQGALAVPLVCAGPGIRSKATLDVPMATVDIGATALDWAGATFADGMTARSFRGLLEGADVGTRNRTVVLSGLQSYDFGSGGGRDVGAPLPNDEGGDGFNFRLAMMEHKGAPYKFVCCLGKCPGAPSNTRKPDADGYTRLLFNTAADPFDMHDVSEAHPQLVEMLRAELPVMHGFNCSAAPPARPVEELVV